MLLGVIMAFSALSGLWSREQAWIRRREKNQPFAVCSLSVSQSNAQLATQRAGSTYPVWGVIHLFLAVITNVFKTAEQDQGQQIAELVESDRLHRAQCSCCADVASFQSNVQGIVEIHYLWKGFRVIIWMHIKESLLGQFYYSRHYQKKPNKPLTTLAFHLILFKGSNLHFALYAPPPPPPPPKTERRSWRKGRHNLARWFLKDKLLPGNKWALIFFFSYMEGVIQWIYFVIWLGLWSSIIGSPILTSIGTKGLHGFFFSYPE